LYYKPEHKTKDKSLNVRIKNIFIKNRKVFGTQKIKVELQKSGYVASRRLIGQGMKEEALVSAYTKVQFKPCKDSCNESKVANILDRKFSGQLMHSVIVSDLTYVRVKDKWNYICVIIDLFNREIIGYRASSHKTPETGINAFSKISFNLQEIDLFHTDRGNEFKNYSIDLLLKTFNIRRSLSKKGSPHDNAVAEATFKVIKTELIYKHFHLWMT
jgi:transposase InsO family protein